MVIYHCHFKQKVYNHCTSPVLTWGQKPREEAKDHIACNGTKSDGCNSKRQMTTEWTREQTGVADVPWDILRKKWAWPGHILRRTDGQLERLNGYQKMGNTTFRTWMEITSLMETLFIVLAKTCPVFLSNRGYIFISSLKSPKNDCWHPTWQKKKRCIWSPSLDLLPVYVINGFCISVEM